MKRFKRQIKKPPNPLFEEWLLSWQKDAAEKGSEMQHSLGKAIRSLRRYPFPLNSGKECIILENFGKKICDMLDKRLEEHKKMFTEEEWRQSQLYSFELGGSSSSTAMSRSAKTATVTSSSVPVSTINCNENVAHTQTPNAKSPKIYVPKYRSGAFAILLALINCHEGGATKEEIHNVGQDFCDTSFTKPLPGTFYTAWSSAATLLKRDLIIKLTGKLHKYKLTETGLELAIKLKEEMGNIISTESIYTSPAKSSTSPLKLQKRKAFTNESEGGSKVAKNSHPLPFIDVDIDSTRDNAQVSNFPLSIPALNLEGVKPSGKKVHKKINKQLVEASPTYDFNVEDTRGSSLTNCSLQETIRLAPGEFDIILLVDIHETEMKKRQRIDATVNELQKRGIRCESRHLTVGDFVWICRSRNKCNASEELVLPYVVERKRMDDFGGSIKDGRFHEQKFRLKLSGLSEMIYLVEKFGKDNQRLGLPLSTIQQAAVNTQVVDGFSVKFSQDHDDSLRYLACLTRHIIRLFRMKTLISCSRNDLGVFCLDSDPQKLMIFSEFNKGSSKIKNFAVKDMLIKHLLQLKGLSVEKATVITDCYETPTALMDALSSGSEKLLADLPCGALRRLGPASAASIHQLYTRRLLE